MIRRKTWYTRNVIESVVFDPEKTIIQLYIHIHNRDICEVNSTCLEVIFGCHFEHLLNLFGILLVRISIGREKTGSQE